MNQPRLIHLCLHLYQVKSSCYHSSSCKIYIHYLQWNSIIVFTFLVGFKKVFKSSSKNCLLMLWYQRPGPRSQFYGLALLMDSALTLTQDHLEEFTWHWCKTRLYWQQRKVYLHSLNHSDLLQVLILIGTQPSSGLDFDLNTTYSGFGRDSC